MLYHIRMESIIFSNKYLKKEYTFSEPINLISDKKLRNILKKENYKNEDCGLTVSSMNNLPVSEFVQIKVNVSKVGVFLVNFEKEKLDEETRKELINKISELKTTVELTEEQQFDKVKNLFLILNESKPVYITFSNNSNVKINKEKFEEFLKDVEINTYLFLLSRPIQIETKVVKNKIRKNKEPKVIQKVHIRDYIVDYVFFGLFCLIMSFSLILGIIMAFNNDSLCALLFALSGIFLGILTYAIFRHIGDFTKFSINFETVKFPALFTFVGLVLGIGLGYLTGFFTIKANEGVVINYTNALIISIPSVIGATLLAMVLGYFIYRLVCSKKSK